MTPENRMARSLERFRPILVTLAESMFSPKLRCYLDASDIVQQTLLEAHNNATLLVTLEEGPFFAWLHRALRHNLLDTIKHLKTRKHDFRRIVRATPHGESSDRVEDNFVAGDTSPSLAVQRNEQIGFMMAAIQRLPNNQRTAIIMKHLRGHKLREVAEILGLSESATAGLLHRGRRTLVRWLQDANHERC